MAAFLGRVNHDGGYNPPPATGTIFDDVIASYWTANWIEPLLSNGIAGGCDTNSYCPENNVTRAVMAVFLLRDKYGEAYISPSATGTMFDDVPVNHWTALVITQLATENIASGCDANFSLTA
jgi:hypothetical protein